MLRNVSRFYLGKHVIINSSARHVFETNGGPGKNYTTALIAISAAGQVSPPFIVYSGKNLINNWCSDGQDGSHYALTGKVNMASCLYLLLISILNKGWINAWSFEYWMREIFVPTRAHINRPLLLIIDGHAAHININIIRLMQENQIIYLVLPPHSTHALQPIDVVLFNNMETDWSNIISNHLKAGNESIKNAYFPRLMKRLFVENQAFSTTRIVSSFARAGKRSTLQTEIL